MQLIQLTPCLVLLFGLLSNFPVHADYLPTDATVNCSMMLSAFVPESERNNTFGEMKCLPPHGKCYMFAHEKYDHDGAIEFCDKYGGIIVRPESDEESEMLATYVNDTFHLGATRISEQDYYDFDQDMPVYANWICFRDLYHGLCLAASTKKGLWRPYECLNKAATICQF
ncbi:hypothetical protein EG68_12100 [Paragonimus skrjabini miyazakii]|uniref:C-type lectin domain-containing protein n=1 Tax=Paragonimus skrjabini miyazakii TaxID=59628 RepID=A0A8S9YEZ1_9TREM|nr:hypothetical protein EG68_12100 [Paragonimus skrjabini miyazakii]